MEGLTLTAPEIDLHTHTTASDGTDTPADVVALAKATGLSAVAITDHDTTDGLVEAAEAGKKNGIEVVPGIEFSTKYRHRVHLLGYFIDPENPELKRELQNIVEDRDRRNERVVSLMSQDGINISYPEMKDRFGEVVGRPHFAQILMKQGLVSSTGEAFAKYLGKGCIYYVPRTCLPLERCFELIQKSGGVAVIAHPLEDPGAIDTYEELLRKSLSCGVKGVECIHSSHTREQTSLLLRKADQYNLIKTGGSDYHGLVKPDVHLGSPFVPYSFLKILKKCRK